MPWSLYFFPSSLVACNLGIQSYPFPHMCTKWDCPGSWVRPLLLEIECCRVVYYFVPCEGGIRAWSQRLRCQSVPSLLNSRGKKYAQLEIGISDTEKYKQEKNIISYHCRLTKNSRTGRHVQRYSNIHQRMEQIYGFLRDLSQLSSLASVTWSLSKPPILPSISFDEFPRLCVFVCWVISPLIGRLRVQFFYRITKYTENPFFLP